LRTGQGQIKTAQRWSGQQSNKSLSLCEFWIGNFIRVISKT